MNRRVKELGLASGLAFLLFASCEDPGIIGLDVDPDNLSFSTNYEAITLPARLSQIDSIQTGGTGTMLIGNYEDPIFGKISARGYAQLGLTDPVIVETTAVFDSLRVNLKYSYVHGVNTANLHGIRVRRLVDDLDTQQEYFANDTSLSTRILYAQDFFNYHITEDEDGAQVVDLDTALTIRMFDSFGEEMLTKMTTQGDSSFLTDVNFQAYLKGLFFEPYDQYETITGFDLRHEASNMILFYHYTNTAGDSINSFVRFSFEFGAHYNSMRFDRSGTNIASTTDALFTEIDADDGLIYLQSLTGLVVKLDFSPFTTWSDQFKEPDEEGGFVDTQNFRIHSAVLTLGRMEPFAPLTAPPQQLIFYFTDSTNRPLRDEASGALRTIQQDNPAIDPKSVTFPALFNFKTADNGIQESYSDLIGSYIQALYDGTITDDKVLVYPAQSSISTTFDRFQLDPQNIKLEVYYSITKEEESLDN